MNIKAGDRIQTIDSYDKGTIIHVGATTLTIDWDDTCMQTHAIESLSFMLIGLVKS